MFKQKVFCLVIMYSFIIGLIAEEGNAEHIILNAKKISIKSLGLYGGVGAGMLAGCFVGCTIMQDADPLAMTAAKIGVLTVIGGVSGAVAGKNIAHKWIEYYYPEKTGSEPLDRLHLTDPIVSDRIIKDKNTPATK